MISACASHEHARDGTLVHSLSRNQPVLSQTGPHFTHTALFCENKYRYPAVQKVKMGWDLPVEFSSLCQSALAAASGQESQLVLVHSTTSISGCVGSTETHGRTALGTYEILGVKIESYFYGVDLYLNIFLKGIVSHWLVFAL